MVRVDAPIFWEECETLATVLAGFSILDFYQWLSKHPKALINIRPHEFIYLCDTHEEIMEGVIQ